ncbi:hypothetical protein FR932_10430 [Moritella marina ATCC 15381]|uniref:Uncharacterized protein n=1 Tax=Moritella marina ATCC 15381 TaxID=1202962 RepID=A0A5J6WJJ5_MORMI|nr:hypothetical protein [Moritella marina]QFI38233.1 hypothetical protein FR932_10430 [Moritella marina ATCC 15381]
MMLIPTHLIKMISLLLVSIVLSSMVIYAPLSAHNLPYKAEAIEHEMHCDAACMMETPLVGSCCESLESNIENQCCFPNATTSHAIISMSALNAHQPFTLSLIHRDCPQVSFAIPDSLYRPPIA